MSAKSTRNRRRRERERQQRRENERVLAALAAEPRRMQRPHQSVSPNVDRWRAVYVGQSDEAKS